MRLYFQLHILIGTSRGLLGCDEWCYGRVSTFRRILLPAALISVVAYHSATRRHKEDLVVNLHHNGNLKSRILVGSLRVAYVALYRFS